MILRSILLSRILQIVTLMKLTHFELARIEGLNFSQSARRVEGIARNLPKASKSQFLFFEQSGARI